jgi:hypothetical protein
MDLNVVNSVFIKLFAEDIAQYEKEYKDCEIDLIDYVISTRKSKTKKVFTHSLINTSTAEKALKELKKEYPEMDEKDLKFSSMLWMHINNFVFHLITELEDLSDERKKKILISVFGIKEEAIKECSFEEWIKSYYVTKYNDLATVLKNCK